jgi:hypothetical protein
MSFWAHLFLKQLTCPIESHDILHKYCQLPYRLSPRSAVYFQHIPTKFWEHHSSFMRRYAHYLLQKPDLSRQDHIRFIERSGQDLTEILRCPVRSLADLSEICMRKSLRSDRDSPRNHVRSDLSEIRLGSPEDLMYINCRDSTVI